jgi:hypothetical protein
MILTLLMLRRDKPREMFNPSRGVDAWGSGEFGASRDGGTRPHLGVDYVVSEGDTIYAPFDMEIYDTSQPYRNNTFFTGIKYDTKVNGVDFNGRMWYFIPYPDIIGSVVTKGQPIGVAQSLQSKYPGITDHIHLQLAAATNVSSSWSTILYKGLYYINPDDVV